MEVLLKRPAVVVERSSDDERRRIKTGKERQVLIESTRAEMVEVREENQRLKTTLTQIIKDYESLQKHFSSVSHRRLPNEPTAADPQEEEEDDVSLSLGTSSSGGQNKDDKVTAAAKFNNDKGEPELGGAQLTLGLACSKFVVGGSSPSSSSSDTAAAPKEKPAVVLKLGDGNESGARPPWPPAKTTLALMSSAAAPGDGRGDDDEDDDDGAPASQLQPQVKRARVSVRTRCDGPTMNDGCQWRKYGQKISKGNPCPRAYYRCTVAPACPVRKQVQRCAEDMSILITTYEGTHNHPLPLSATAMASTTAAAASMLMSGSSSSQPAASAPINFLSSSTYSSSSSSYLISSTSSHPTVTLDLTSPPQSQYLSRLSLSSKYPPSTPRSFSFSSQEIITSSSLPSSWSNRSPSSYFSYGAQAPYCMSSLGGQSSYLQKTTTTPLITDTIAKVITADPKFQSALSAAISSYVEGERRQQHGVRWPGEQSLSAGSSSSMLASVNGGCATSFLADRPSTTTGLSLSTQGSTPAMKPSTGFPGTVRSSTAGASASPEYISRGNIK